MAMVDHIKDHASLILRQIDEGIMEADAALRKNGGRVEDEPCTVNIRMQDEWASVEYSVTFRPGRLKKEEEE